VLRARLSWTMFVVEVLGMEKDNLSVTKLWENSNEAPHDGIRYMVSTWTSVAWCEKLSDARKIAMYAFKPTYATSRASIYRVIDRRPCGKPLTEVM
jgi:hypothetical protein